MVHLVMVGHEQLEGTALRRFLAAARLAARAVHMVEREKHGGVVLAVDLGAVLEAGVVRLEDLAGLAIPTGRGPGRGTSAVHRHRRLIAAAPAIETHVHRSATCVCARAIILLWTRVASEALWIQCGIQCGFKLGPRGRGARGRKRTLHRHGGYPPGPCSASRASSDCGAPAR